MDSTAIKTSVRGLLEAARVRWEYFRPATARDAFDDDYRVETRVVPTLGELWRTIRSGGHEYEPSPPKRFRELLDGLAFDFKHTVFVDYGSGAGRAVLLAAEYPFKDVIGLELAPSLHARARGNLRAARPERRRAGAVHLVCRDATTYELPREPLVLYFYNPFGVGAMRRTLATIEASLSAHPRPITLVLAYCYKAPREVLEASAFFRRVSVDRGVTILESVNAPAGVRREPSLPTA